ncbi:hypothetical protein F4703DRAFT_1819324 [Phycomyces blakesleeanus]
MVYSIQPLLPSIIPSVHPFISFIYTSPLLSARNILFNKTSFFLYTFYISFFFSFFCFLYI